MKQPPPPYPPPVRAGDFEYSLPPDRIAHFPAPTRDGSRLLVYQRVTRRIEHRQFRDLPEFLAAGDVLVLNDSKVIRARLRGRNAKSGGALEVLLLEENETNNWWVMLRPGRRAHPGTRIELHDRRGQPTPVSATVMELNEEGHRRLQFHGAADILENLEELGEVPVPPYIRRENELALDEDRYQTVYATTKGSVAAPTAGLHFTPQLLASIRERGVRVETITLHVGLGTFAPLKVDALEDHRMHEERFVLSKEAVQQCCQAKANGKRVIPVGTTSLRALESAVGPAQTLLPGLGRTRLFIHPPYEFRVADALVTNFHLPRSTLLMLVSAFASPGSTEGTAEILRCYREAIDLEYRFFSYGDAMLIL